MSETETSKSEKRNKHENNSTNDNYSDKPKQDKEIKTESGKAISIIEKVLGNNNFLLGIYYKDTINLVKSIIVKTNIEAEEYNELIVTKYGLTIDYTDPTTWRYYKHLSCQYHSVDIPIYLNSVDNFDNIELTIPNLNLHKKTKEKLLEFDLLYNELVNKYPEQELYIKSCLVNINKEPLELFNLEDFTIVGYNNLYVEDNELDLMYKLQELIDNYKNTWLLTYYHLSDSLFIVVQFIIFYQFLITSILGLRLANAKTNKAHSFHIKNYLSSHHQLDKYYNYLTKTQVLFLYKNLLYLDTHAGKNIIFNLLIDKLFSERNISIVTYDSNQINNLDADNYIEYKFKQRLLNNKNLIQSNSEFELDSIKKKEYNLAFNNKKHLDFEINKIDSKFKNCLFTSLLTKDLETIVIDHSDVVKHKLIPTIIDYWAYLCKTNRINYVINFTNPISNVETVLSVKDAFKLFIILLYKSNNITLSEFPNYTIKRVYKETLPTTDTLLSSCYKKHYWYKNKINNIKNLIPSYSNIVTSYLFKDYLSSVYLLNIGLWLDNTNMSDKDTEGQFSNIVNKLHMSDEYIINDETVDEFLIRYNMTSILTYDTEVLLELNATILDKIYDNKLLTLFNSKYIQKAMVEIFNNFKSYSTQIFDNYYLNDVLMVGPRDTRCTISESIIDKFFHYNSFILNITTSSNKILKEELKFKTDVTDSYSYLNELEINLSSNFLSKYKVINKVDIMMNKINISVDNENFVISPSTNEDMIFLIENS